MPRFLQRHYGGSILNANNTPSVSIADSASLKPAGNLLSVELWVKPQITKLQDYNVLVAKTTSAAWTDGWSIYFDQYGSLKFFVNNYSTSTTFTGNGKLVNNQWQHIVAVYNGVDLRLYVNSVQRGTPFAYSTNINHSNANLWIGTNLVDGAQFHASNFAETRIYSRALSAQEVSDRYFLGRDDSSMRTGLVGEWNFADVSGTTCVDRSGNSNTATLFSADMASTDSPMKSRAEIDLGAARTQATNRVLAANRVVTGT